MATSSRTLEAKRCLVTGAASGIGRATCELLVERGARVAVVDLQADAAAEVAGHLAPDAARAFGADVSDEGQVSALVQDATGWLGGLDVLINCAGVGGIKPAPLGELDLATWRRTIDTNLTGTYLVSRHATAHLVAAGHASVVNLASTYALVAGPNLAAYAASKAGIVQLTRTMAVEYAAAGVRANAIAPGFVDTPMLRGDIAKEPDPAAALADVLRRIPQGTLMTPQQVARVIAFLASDDAEIITGTLLVADGGFTAL
jgi:NAD(P)-dependent dehydrogenase (short-subunit alcohol dehydrogenase family)